MEDNSSFRLQKISMIVADVLLVLMAIYIAFSGDGPMSPVQAFWVIVCITIGGVLAFIPFYMEVKIRANLAELDLSQANVENSRRIEHALVEMQDIAAGVTQQADRAEQLSTKFEGLMASLDAKLAKDQEAHGKLNKDKQDIAKAMTEMRDELTKALAEGPNAEDTAALIGGIEVALGNLSTQMEQMQFFLAKEAAQQATTTTTLDDLTPETATEGDEAVESSTFIDEDEPADDEEPDGDEKATEEPIEDSVEEDAEEEAETDEEIDNAEPDADESLAEDDPAEENASIEEEPAAEPVEDEATTDTDEDAEPEIVEDGPVFTDARDVEATESDETDLETAVEDFPDEAPEDEEASDESDETDDILDISDEHTAEDEAETIDDEVLTPEPEVSESVEDDPTKTLSGAKLEELDEFGDISMSTPLPDETEEAETAEASAAAAEDLAEDAPASGQQDLMVDLPAPTKKKKKKAKKSDGEAATLVAQVLIGIGNKPYVRGQGPGLSEDEGVAMEFVEIGKWQWVAPESDVPVVCQIYKNDEVPADGDMIELEPGQRRTVNPDFPA